MSDTEQEALLINAFEIIIVCPKCGQQQTHEGLLKDATCTNCGKDLVKELF